MTNIRLITILYPNNLKRIYAQVRNLIIKYTVILCSYSYNLIYIACLFAILEVNYAYKTNLYNKYIRMGDYLSNTLQILV